MSKIVRTVVIAVLVATPAFGAAATTASTRTLGAGIGWDQAPTSAAAAGTPVTSAATPSQADGIGWD
ncbi:hypothetical protein [Streptomyces camelliae]|uniref:5'-nucleotidase n=1 Tax=Streptomyces camelliae TaxID=3004093 RepID=A0ABY7NTE4_9ACTN|nr:hypothetical protein [Streptomyces sp. HUAS 2-6]WBO61508.1 hypothetical protein O1G22_00760 [Streptomyces sp. HUAS 2-6]